jgi:hypothetical protein
MVDAKLSCPRCKGSMEEGFVLELGHSNNRYVATWIRGTPEVLSSRRTFLIFNPLRGLSHRPITCYRCIGCGYLESYAR